MHKTFPLLLVACLLACGSSSSPSKPAQGGPMTKLGERALPFDPAAAGSRVHRPYFDAQGELAWDASPATGPACGEGETERRRTTWLRTPRVDVVRCGGAGPSAPLVVAYDPQGNPLWRRPLGFKTGPYTLDEGVIGASGDGVVLSNLTLLHPATGEVLLPPKTHPVGTEARPVPDHSLSPPALYLPDRKVFVHFSADVTLLHHEGGLFQLDLRSGAQTLLLPVAASGLGTAWRVEDLARSADGRFLYLATKHGVRGGGGVALSVLDLKSGDQVFSQRFRDDHFCVDPRLALGPDGRVGLSFVDQTEGKVVLVTYRSALPV